MSTWSDADETTIWRAVVVQERGREDVDALDYLRERSRADPEGVKA
jgi:hypothetical protein